MTTLLQQALEIIEAQKAWIMAVPDSTPLPTMPGFDRDWADTVEARIRAKVAQPESEPTSDREALIKQLRRTALAWRGDENLNDTAEDCALAAQILEADALNDDLMLVWQKGFADGRRAQQVAVPPGYALVPIEPTQDQWKSGFDCLDGTGVKVGKIYQAMLKAAPQPAAYVPLTEQAVRNKLKGGI